MNATRRARFGGRPRPGLLALIAIGGALGTLARYEMAQLIHVAKDTFPWATFTTNLTGAFVLGVFSAAFVERFPLRFFPRALVAIGFLGAFTTFSTMAVETVTLIKDGDALIGITYIVVSVGAGLAAAYAGIVCGRVVPGRAQC